MSSFSDVNFLSTKEPFDNPDVTYGQIDEKLEDFSNGECRKDDFLWSPESLETESVIIDNALDDITKCDIIDGDTDDSEENYGIGRIREIMQQCQNCPEERPALSYIALIGMAIQTSENRRLLLSDIYQWIMMKFPYFKSSDRSWRNSVRHNLSLNECFVKTGRSDNGKGNYWIIHPANVDDFSQGDFRRRMARIKVRQSKTTSAPTAYSTHSIQESFDVNSTVSNSPDPVGWTPMTVWSAPVTSLIELFGVDAILSKKDVMLTHTHVAGDSFQTGNGMQFYSDGCTYYNEVYSKAFTHGSELHSGEYSQTHWLTNVHGC